MASVSLLPHFMRRFSRRWVLLGGVLLRSPQPTWVREEGRRNKSEEDEDGD